MFILVSLLSFRHFPPHLFLALGDYSGGFKGASEECWCLLSNESNHSLPLIIESSSPGRPRALTFEFNASCINASPAGTEISSLRELITRGLLRTREADIVIQVIIANDFMSGKTNISLPHSLCINSIKSPLNVHDICLRIAIIITFTSRI